MKKLLSILVVLVAVLAVVSCGKKNKTTVDSVLANAKLENTTIKATLTMNYNVTVDANGGDSDFSSFRHEIRAVSEIEIDLADPYLYIKKTWNDQLDTDFDAVTKEYLVTKEGNDYVYVSTSTTKEVVSGDVKAFIERKFTEVTKEQAGTFDFGVFLYGAKDMEYEHSYFGLTSNLLAEDLNPSEVVVNSNKGLDVTYKAEFVGYETDQGLSNFPAAKGKSEAAVVNISTDAEARVTSLKETYSAGLDFAIMTPKPTVGLEGTRELKAAYGEQLTKKTANDIQYVAPTARVILGEAENGVVALAWLDYDHQDFTTHVIENKADVEVGMWVAVAAVANAGYEVASVKANGEETEVVIGGNYYFKVTEEGAFKVNVAFKKAGQPADQKQALGAYEGTASNGTVMTVTVYVDGTFDISAMGVVCGNGTYTKEGSVMNAVIDPSSVKFWVATSNTCAFELAADFSTLTATPFFNGDNIVFTLKNSEGGGQPGPGPEGPQVLGAYSGTASNGTVMTLTVYADGTFKISAMGMDCGNGSYSKDGSNLNATIDSASIKFWAATQTDCVMVMAPDFSTITTTPFFNGDTIIWELVQ